MIRNVVFRGVVAAAAGLLALTGCSATGAGDGDPALLKVIDRVDAVAYEAANPGSFVELSRDSGLESVSLLNYDPTRPPPSRQDVVAWGRVGSGPETRGSTVLSVAVQVGQQFYVVEFDPTSREQLFEDGSWFLPEEQAAYVSGQLDKLDALMA